MSNFLYSEEKTGGRTIQLAIPWDTSGSGLIPPGKITFMQWVGPKDEHVPVEFFYVGLNG
jgi:hypothetical protein